MGKPLIDFFGAIDNGVDGLNESVASFINHGSWELPQLLQIHYPALCELISKVPIATNPTLDDTLIWSPSSSGELTAKLAFQFLRQPLPSMDWGKCIWSKYITPRISLLTWKVLRGRVLTDDFLLVGWSLFGFSLWSLIS
ncbi:uncharacterized protein LOC133737984 [Rosa rugosa]|uniref:uncharacterized protein LOC133737984 n=1 Tax=Rosa rugosa TaxID=74645 RepID=UPI002B4124CE|nr:uncharacterized protein LOC133737984 [Rosa rugosa]